MFLNKIFVIGNLTRDPELKSLPNGTAVANFSLATNRVWKNKDGQKQEQVEFHNIVVFARMAKNVAQYMGKGDNLLVEGRIQTRSWEAQDGSKRYRTEIVADSIQFGSKRQGGANSEQSAPQETQGRTSSPEEQATEDYEGLI